MRIGSLFSGAGGLDLAVEQVFGAHTVWHCENDAAASKVLAARWPRVPNHHDITAVDWGQVEPVDMLCGGWPCQPFSLAGKRKGADDERALWPHVARAVRMVRPRIVVLENVPAVLGPEFTRVANDLASLRYDIAWTCLRASDVGAPHRRERVFILATDTTVAERGGTQQQHLGTTLVGASEPRERPRAPTCRGSNAADTAGVELLPTPVAQRSGRNQSLSPGAAIRPSLDSITELLPTPQAFDSVDHVRTPEKIAGTLGGGCRNLREAVVNELLPTPNASDGTGGGQHPDKRDGHSQQLIDYVLAPEQWGKYAPAIHRWEQVTRPAPAPTEPNTKGNPRLSAAFSEWLMGWPAGWVTDIDISRNDQLRIIGNGVVPQQAQAALRWLLSVSEAAA